MYEQRCLYLVMKIGNVLISRKPVEYEGMVTVEERQDHQEKIAAEMRQKNWMAIQGAGIEPKFYMEYVPSKMNDIDFKINENELQNES